MNGIVKDILQDELVCEMLREWKKKNMTANRIRSLKHVDNW